MTQIPSVVELAAKWKAAKVAVQPDCSPTHADYLGAALVLAQAVYVLAGVIRDES